MPTQGEEILQQLRRYEEGKREPPQAPTQSKPDHDDELLNSQLELMQLATSPGTLTMDEHKQQQQQQQQQTTGHYASLKILARDPRYFPPLNFGVVDSDVYRCGHPQAVNFAFLESLHLKTIVYVGDKTNNWEYYRWIQQQEGLQFVHVPVAVDGSARDTQRLQYILDVVTCAANYPLLIHSNKGKHRVGVVVALIRKAVHGWVLAAVYDEYGKYAKHGKDNSELQLIEFF